MSVSLGIAKTLAGVSGLVLCYGSLFLYEDEQRRVQSTLENLWVRIEDLRLTAVRGHVAVLRVAAEATLRFLDRLFGETLQSVRAIGVGACLSLLSMLLMSNASWWLFMRLFASKPLEVPRPHSAVASGAMLSLLLGEPFVGGKLEPTNWAVYGVAGAATLAVLGQARTPKLAKMPMIVVTGFLILFAIATVADTESATGFLVPLFALAVGVVCDLAAIAMLRPLLRRQAASASGLIIMFTALAELSVALLLVLAPLVLTAIAFTLLCAVIYFVPSGTIVAMNAMFGVLIALTSNFISLALALTFFAAIALLAAHRMFWPVVVRPLYLIARLRLFASWPTRAAVFALGVSLLAVSAGKAVDSYQAIRAVLGAA